MAVTLTRLSIEMAAAGIQSATVSDRITFILIVRGETNAWRRWSEFTRRAGSERERDNYKQRNQKLRGQNRIAFNHLCMGSVQGACASSINCSKSARQTRHPHSRRDRCELG